MLFVDCLFGVVVSMSDYYHGLLGSVSRYTLVIVLEQGAPNLMGTIG